jgi:hypothetical protein
MEILLINKLIRGHEDNFNLIKELVPLRVIAMKEVAILSSRGVIATWRSRLCGDNRIKSGIATPIGSQ